MVLDPMATSNQENPNPNMVACEECGQSYWPESIKDHKSDAHKAEKAEHPDKDTKKKETK